VARVVVRERGKGIKREKVLFGDSFSVPFMGGAEGRFVVLLTL